MSVRDAILRALASEPWAIERRALEQLLVTGSLEDLRAAAVARSRSVATASSTGDTAVIPILGVITRRASWLTDLVGGSPTDWIAAAVRAAVADKKVGRILLLIDSPGGTVSGTPELANTIRLARGRKPIVAVVEGYAASAAYWIAAQATTIVASPSSELGSIGVYSLHVDTTGALDKAGIIPTFIAAPGAAKVEMSPLLKLSDRARAYEQAAINRLYGDFITDVGLGRRVGRSFVREMFGGGRMIAAREAVSLGMADQLGTLDVVLGWGSHEFESERRAMRGLRPPTFAQERAERARRARQHAGVNR